MPVPLEDASEPVLERARVDMEACKPDDIEGEFEEAPREDAGSMAMAESVAVLGLCRSLAIEFATLGD